VADREGAESRVGEGEVRTRPPRQTIWFRPGSTPGPLLKGMPCFKTFVGLSSGIFGMTCCDYCCLGDDSPTP